jgi:hypothetical protein
LGAVELGWAVANSNMVVDQFTIQIVNNNQNRLQLGDLPMVVAVEEDLEWAEAD